MQRAQSQDRGARWLKTTDPSGRSSRGEIDELLIWQQPHPLMVAEYGYCATRSDPCATLGRWREVVHATAD